MWVLQPSQGRRARPRLSSTRTTPAQARAADHTARVDRRSGAAAKETHSGKGRLDGLQSNDVAEAMALLQAMRHIHPETKVNMHIDNTGVIDTAKAMGHSSNKGRTRSKQGGRAVWARIRKITEARGETNYKWIHSHVDDEKRQEWNENSRYECACGGQGIGKCDPEHEHHKGNERADEL